MSGYTGNIAEKVPGEAVSNGLWDQPGLVVAAASLLLLFDDELLLLLVPSLNTSLPSHLEPYPVMRTISHTRTGLKSMARSLAVVTGWHQHLTFALKFSTEKESGCQGQQMLFV